MTILRKDHRDLERDDLRDAGLSKINTLMIPFNASREILQLDDPRQNARNHLENERRTNDQEKKKGEETEGNRTIVRNAVRERALPI